MKKITLAVSAAVLGASIAVNAKTNEASDSIINEQRQALAENTLGKGYGPQAPRDISIKDGENDVVFNLAPSTEQMNLCNIHFHKGAEHKGGEFTKYAGDGDGSGYNTGYLYSGNLSESELKPVEAQICAGKHGSLVPGDTIEIHYVHTSAQIEPGPTLGSCISESITNPQLRVEAQVFVLVNDDQAADFTELTKLDQVDGYFQAPKMPSNTGEPVVYSGSTTGAVHNEVGSPFQVTWSVRPNVTKVNIASVGEWCKSNEFEEDHAHSVRNLITNPELLSPIE